jgi:hypothetical protein
VRAAQVREAARLLDMQHVSDEEIVTLEERGRNGTMLTIGPRLFPRSLPPSLAPRQHLIDRDGFSTPAAEWAAGAPPNEGGE